MHNKQIIKSEIFSESYCIFIDKNVSSAFKNKIKTYKNKSIKIISGNFENNPTCIVIPNKLDFKKIENDLFQLDESKFGFWGQYGIGYNDKTWTEI
jgi:hypothetical protein